MQVPAEVETGPVRKRRRFGLRGLTLAVALLAVLFARMARDTRTPFEKLRGEWTRSEHAFIEAMDRAKTDEAAGIRNRGLGETAPAMVGQDLDGRSMSLADHRGKVVLISFWATWRGPCMRMIPHERALLARFKGRDFAIVGVNGDRDPKALGKVLAQTDIPWRSFRDARPDLETLSEQWKVGGWPTFSLIDREGIVREREIGLLLEAKSPEK